MVSPADTELLKRWNEVAVAPLRYSPLADAAVWRAARKLDKDPQLGVIESGNVLIDAAKNPVLRAAFYEPYWPLLVAAFMDIHPQTLRNESPGLRACGRTPVPPGRMASRCARPSW